MGTRVSPLCLSAFVPPVHQYPPFLFLRRHSQERLTDSALCPSKIPSRLQHPDLLRHLLAGSLLPFWDHNNNTAWADHSRLLKSVALHCIRTLRSSFRFVLLRSRFLQLRRSLSSSNQWLPLPLLPLLHLPLPLPSPALSHHHPSSTFQSAISSNSCVTLLYTIGTSLLLQTAQ